MNGNVQMALAPEEKTILEQVLALIQDLMSMQGGETPAPEITEAIPPDDMGYEEEEDIQKSVTEETGDTKAEDRLDNQATELTDDNLSSLKKTMSQLQALVGKKRTVQKTRQESAVLNELKKLNQNLKTVVKAQAEQEIFNQNIMRSIGFSDELVTKTLEEHKETVQKNKPYNSGDAMLFAKDIIAEVMKNLPQAQQPVNNVDYNHPFNQNRRFGVNKSNTRKPIHDVLDFIHKGTRGVA